MRAQHWLLLCLLATSILCIIAQEDVAGDANSILDPAAAAEEPPTPAQPKKAKAATAVVLSIGAAEAEVIAASGKRLSRKAADYGQALLDGVSLEAGASIEVTFTPQADGAASKPQQAMLLLQPKAHKGLSAYAVAKARKDGAHVVSLSQALVEKQLGSLGGKLSVTLLLGDPAAPKGVRWELGTIKLPAAEAGLQPSPVYRTALVQPISNVLPNIAHIFRQPDKRPAAAVSLVFTALALAPLALLLLFLLATGGLGLQNFPTGAGSLWALLFHGGIASILVLYWLFWTRLNLAQTLPPALGLGAVTAAVGYKALGALADARLQQERAGATPAKKGN